ncbi:hypothetical protein Tco_0763018 [Tanacetum coccineum]
MLVRKEGKLISSEGGSIVRSSGALLRQLVDIRWDICWFSSTLFQYIIQNLTHPNPGCPESCVATTCHTDGWLLRNFKNLISMDTVAHVIQGIFFCISLMLRFSIPAFMALHKDLAKRSAVMRGGNDGSSFRHLLGFGKFSIEKSSLDSVSHRLL